MRRAESGDEGAGATHSERLERMRRPADYPLTILAINPLNRCLVRPLHRLGVSPNAITWLSFFLAALAALSIWYGIREAPWWRWLMVPGLVFVSHMCDALDGDLARYSGRSSLFGAALDPTLDRAREALYVGAVACGVGGWPVWAGRWCTTTRSMSKGAASFRRVSTS